MAKLNSFFQAVAAGLLAAALTAAIGPGAFGATFLTVASLKVAAITAGLTLLSALLRKDAETEQRTGLITSAVSPARYVYGRRSPPLDVVAVMDRINADGDAFRGIVVAISEGPGIELESVKIEGVFYPVPPPAATAHDDGGIRYMLSKYLDITIYNRADGAQGAAIREFSARQRFIANSRLTSYTKPSDIPGGDSGSGADPFSIVSSSVAKSTGATPSLPTVDAIWELRYDPDDPTEQGPVTGAYLELFWTTEDPDIAGIRYSVYDSDEPGTTWVDADDPGIPNTQAGDIDVYTETRAGMPGLDSTEGYRVALQTWRLDAGGNRVYSGSATDTEESLDDRGPPSTAGLKWTTRHKGTGISYAFIRLRQPKKENHWTATPDVQLGVKGRSFPWPGQSAAAYTRNVVAVIYDLLRQCGEPDSAFTDSQWQTEIDHANEVLPLSTKEQQSLKDRGYEGYAGHTHIRYGCDITITSTDNISDVLQSLLVVAGEGSLYSWKDKWVLGVGRAKAVRRIGGTAAIITKGDLAEPPIFRPASPLAQRYNAVRFSLDQSVEHNYESTLIQYEDETARKDRDFGRLFLKDLGRLTTLTDPVAAHRIASTILERGRKSMTVSCHLRGTDDLRWVFLEPNDVVKLEEDVVAGYSSRNQWLGRVDSVTVEPDLSVSLVLLEEVASIWSDSLLLPDFKPRTTFNPDDVPKAVAGLALNEFVRVSRGFPVVYIEATFTDDESGIPVRLRWRITALDGAAISSPSWRIKPFGDLVIEPAIVGATYEVQAQRGYPGGGFKSLWSASVTDTVDGPLDPPSALTGMSAFGIAGGYVVQWTDPTVADVTSRLELVEVYDSTDTTKTEPAVGDLRRRVPRGLSAVNVSDLTGTDERKVWIRPVNIFGNSGGYTSAVVTPAAPIAGSKWYTGAGVPANIVGVDGDFYLRTADSTIWEKKSGAWVEVADLSGSDGAEWHTGAGAPAAALGKNGDWYFRTGADAAEIYTKIAGSWVKQFDIDDGDDGTVWHAGMGQPAGSLGAVGDYYFRTDNGFVYEKTAATEWTYRADITGPQGPDGRDGAGIEDVYLVRNDPAVPAIPTGSELWPYDRPVAPWTDGALMSATKRVAHWIQRRVPGTPAVGAVPPSGAMKRAAAGWTAFRYQGSIQWGEDGEDGPGAPTDLTGSATKTDSVVSGLSVQRNAVRISWTSAAGAQGHDITYLIVGGAAASVYRGIVASSHTVALFSNRGATLILVTVRSYRVVAGKKLTSAAEITVRITGEVAETVLGIPSVTGRAGDGRVVLDWENISGAIRYQVQRATSVGQSAIWTTIVTNRTSSDYTDTTAVRGTSYYYRVRAETATVNGSFSSAAGPFTPPERARTSPSAPRNLGAVVNEGGAVVSWTAPSSWGTGSNRRYVGSSRVASAGWPTSVTLGATVTSRSFTGLTNGTTYQARLKAVTDDGESSYVTVSFTPTAPPPPPSGGGSNTPPGVPTGNQLSTSGLQSWNAVTDLGSGGSATVSYRVRICLAVGGTCSSSSGITGTEHQWSVGTGLGNLRPGTAYRSQVQAYTWNAADRTSNWSAESSETTIA